jgi:L-ascorbate metabolism protein UlaG (beta-lactamase superfamily)
MKERRRKEMKYTQIRHGSHLIDYKGKKYLVDPVFAEKGTMSALPMGRVKEMNPLVAMPMDFSFLKEVNALILTHLHFDHFDDKAKEMLPKDIKIYCHKADENKVRKDGFTNVKGFDGEISLGDHILLKTINGGRHGKGLRRIMMGRTTGYIFTDQSKSEKEPTLYLTGDSIWCDSVRGAIDANRPQVIVAFAGQAKLMGGSITMGAGDLDELATYVKNANIIANHLDTWNHCYLTRSNLKSFLVNKSYKNRFFIPDDGETLVLE